MPLLLGTALGFLGASASLAFLVAFCHCARGWPTHTTLFRRGRSQWPRRLFLPVATQGFLGAEATLAILGALCVEARWRHTRARTTHFAAAHPWLPDDRRPPGHLGAGLWFAQSLGLVLSRPSAATRGLLGDFSTLAIPGATFPPVGEDGIVWIGVDSHTQPHKIFISLSVLGAVGHVLDHLMRAPGGIVGANKAACRPSHQFPWGRSCPKFAGNPHWLQRVQKVAHPSLQRSPGARCNIGFRQLLAWGSLGLRQRGSMCSWGAPSQRGRDEA